MKSATPKIPAQIVRSRGIGVLVGTLIGAGWMAYGLSGFPNMIAGLLGLMGLAAVIPLLVGSRRLIATARTLSAPDAAARLAARRLWRLFWINFAVEIVLLNVVVNLLARPALHIYWIPAISFIVGLHFLPMASFFSFPSYWGCGGAMIGTAAAITLAIGTGVAAPQILVAAEAVINAIILWAVAGWGLRTAARLLTHPNPP